MIQLPPQLAKLLESNLILDGSVRATLGRVVPLLAGSSLPFFPEYTDHGLNHVCRVLETSDAIIPSDSRHLLTPGDAGCLILAIVLHDLGMHLTEDGFLTLISPSSAVVAPPQLADLDARSWSSLWEDFVSEAKRFDGKKLSALFGDANPVRRPPADPQDFTQRDRKLIGEFLRRHHPRLAHEVAILGFPGVNGRLSILDDSFPHDLKDISGLVARSHGMSPRACFSYLERHFHLRDFQGVHAVYLMTLLRVADYLQVDAARAPADRLRITGIKSPFSRGEWLAHQAVRNLTFEGNDPEALEIKAVPETARTFNRLKEIIQGLQSELDLSWAVLGEVYGHSGLSGLGLQLRRVRSNLDEQSSLPSLSFVPVKASFETADAELLTLLVEPLYGTNNIHIGVRELLQNAVDACRELADVCSHSARTPPAAGQDCDVLVQLSGDDSNGWVLAVSDCGIGMSAETLCRYFLQAGASYRRSDTWKKLHEDQVGHSRVLRSGRFGIGVLAAFLLGDEIEVTTRHIDERADRAITFQATLETDQLEMRYCSAPVGTRISVRLHKAAAEAFKVCQSRHAPFGQLPDKIYLLNSPSIQMLLPRRQDPGQKWPSAGEAMQNGWRCIRPPNFEVHWRYVSRSKDNPDYAGPGFACNGFAIASRPSSRTSVSGWRDPRTAETFENCWRKDCGGYGFRIPAISIFDPDGRLPLTLQRNDLRSIRLPFQEELISDICRDILANSLADPRPGSWFAAEGKMTDVPTSQHPALDGGDIWHWLQGPPRSHLALGNEGFSVQDDWLLGQLSCSRLLIIQGSGFELGRPEPGTFVTSTSSVGSLQQSDALAQACFDNQQFQILTSGFRLIVSHAVAKRWPNQKFTRSRYELLKLVGETRSSRTYEHRCGDKPSPFLNVPANGKWLVAELFPSEKNQVLTQTPLGGTFMDYLGTPLIPYSMEQRREKFGHVFNDLRSYMRPQRSSSPKRKL